MSLCTLALPSSSSAYVSRSQLRMQSTRHSGPQSQPAPSIASLPSFTHSLSNFPTMTSVTKDMVHYGTLCRTKGVSEAKVRRHRYRHVSIVDHQWHLPPQLNSALQKTRQRQEAGAPTRVSTLKPSAHSLLFIVDRFDRQSQRSRPILCVHLMRMTNLR